MKPGKKKALRRRQNTERIINKRLGIIRSTWYSDFRGYIEKHPWLSKPGRVNKYNLRCGCRMCRIKDKHTRQELVLEARKNEKENDA